MTKRSSALHHTLSRQVISLKLENLNIFHQFHHKFSRNIKHGMALKEFLITQENVLYGRASRPGGESIRDQLIMPGRDALATYFYFALPYD